MRMIDEDVAVVSRRTGSPPDVVYGFASRMDELPSWASGLARGIEQRAGEWFAMSPMGEVKVAMVPANPHGVLDHTVTLPDGTTVFNALRVTPCGSGSLLTFVVLRDRTATRERFEADVAHVERDLATLADLVDRTGR